MRRIKNLIKIEGTVFESFNHLNQWLLEYIERRTTDKVMEAFKEERQTLLPVPKREESILCRIEDSTVTAFGTARMGTHCYSVPDWGIKGKCRLVRGPYDVKIYQKSAPFKLMATHPLKEGDSILLEHVISSLVKKPQAMIRWRHRDILFPRPIFKKFYQRLKKQCPDDAIRDFLKSINLIHHVDRSELEVGMDLVLETDSDNLYEELCSLLVKERRPGQLLNLETKLNQKKLRPNLEVFDQLIPKGGSQ